MFNLEPSITQWRQRMTKAGVKSPTPLDELESHLRDDIDAQIRSGVDPQAAFHTAAQRIGEARTLKTEFAKQRPSSRVPSLIMGATCAILVLCALGFSGLTFWFLKMSVGDQLVAYTAVVLTMVVSCGWRYAVPFLPIISHSKTRVAVGIACTISGYLLASLFCGVIVPHLAKVNDGIIPAAGFWTVFIIAVGHVLGLGLVMDAKARADLGMIKV